MDNEVKQRNRRRKRAQRMQAQRANKTVRDGDSGEDESPAREKPVRPPNRRKKSKEPLVEEDIIDGFAILGFRTYEDLENVIALSAGGGKPVAKARTEKNSANSTITAAEDRPKLDTGQRNNAITAHTTTHSLLVSHSHGGDAGTSDDSGRASERLTGSSVAPRDPDSSRDRLSDASSRCSSGKGYICDSEGEDDKGSDAGSVLFASTPTPPQQTRKHEFPGSGLPPGVPGAGGASPVPAPMSPCLAPPAPSPAPAALPPPPPYAEPLKPPTAHTPNVPTQQQHGGAHVPPISQVVVGPNAGVGQDRGAAPPHDRTAPPPPHDRTAAPPHDRTAPPSNHERTVLPSNHERTSSSNSLSSNLATTNHERTNHNVINHNVIISSNHSVTSLSNVNSQAMTTIGGAETASNKTIAGHQYTSNHSIMSLSGNAQMHPQSMSAASINNQAVPPTQQQQQQQQQPAHIGHSMPPVHHSGIGLTNHSTMPPNQQQSMQQQQSGHANVQPHHQIAPPPSINSIPNHVLPPNQPNHSLSNHPAQTLPVSRAPSPPPPLSAATPPASLPAALPQSAMAPATTSSPFISNGTPTNGYQQSTAPFPTYPPLYAPYAATMRNSVQPMPQHKSMMQQQQQQQQQQPPSTLTSVSSHAVSQVPTVAMTSAPPVITIPQVTSVAAITTSHRDTITTATLSSSRTHSPRGHSPTRERDSYSSNVSSLSRSSITPVSIPYSSTASSNANLTSTMAFSKTGSTAPTGRSWSSSPAGTIQGPGGVTLPGARMSPAPPPRPTPPPPTSVAAPPPTIHSFPTPMFAPPLAPPPVSAASPLGLQPNPNPFSADSLFQSKPRPVTSHLMPDQADLLRRELDNRFLASQDRAAMAAGVAPPPSTYLRTEMHQHQHHHTHVHQHAAPLLPPPPTAPSVVPPPSLFPPPLFKDIPKMGSVDSPFYRQNLGLSSYPGYSPGLLHPGLGGPTPFVPPNHLPSFQPKQPLGESSKPKIVKTGKWNAMHVRVAWEIYHHQQKQQAEMKPGGVGGKTDLLRPPSHVFPGGLVHTARPHDLPQFHRPPPFDTGPHPANIFASPSHLGGMSPFSRYGSAFPNPGSPFGMSPFPPPGRELPPLGSLHDPWSRSVSALQRTVASYPTPVPSAWSLKPDPAAVERREQEERERERMRRERERERERERKQQEERERERERERREKERREMERRELERLHQQRLAENKARERSPMRNGNTEDIRVKEEPRQPKEDDVVMLTRTDPRYHPYLRHPPNSLVPPGPPRSMIPPPPTLGAPPTGMPPHYPPTTMAGCWPPPPTGDPFRDPYRYEPLRYNPLMEAAMRAEEERVKMFNAYANPHLRPPGGKDPATLLHMRSGPGPGPPGPQPPHMTAPPQAKDDSSQSR